MTNEKCPCLTDVQSCCACVSMHCDECHKPKQSKFVQGRFCSNCGRPLKAELTRVRVPNSEIAREIITEIEKRMERFTEVGYVSIPVRDLKRDLAELKKKYTEDKNV